MGQIEPAADAYAEAIRLHPENETRLLSVLVTDTQEQTRAVFEALADEDTKEPDCAPWHALQTWLASGPREVTIPFAKVLAKLVPPSATRLRRDFRAVLTLIRVHALLHQVNRKQDDNGRIVATLDDYAAVRDIVADVVAQAVEATVPSIVRETVDAVRRRTKDGQDHVSLAELAEDLSLDKATVSRRVRAARDRGYLKDEETKRGRP